MHLSEHLEGYDKDLAEVVLGIAEVSKDISRGFITHQGKADTSNFYGDQQAAMDIWADDLFIKELGDSGLVRYLASEEQPEVLEDSSTTKAISKNTSTIPLPISTKPQCKPWIVKD